MARAWVLSWFPKIGGPKHLSPDGGGGGGGGDNEWSNHQSLFVLCLVDEQGKQTSSKVEKVSTLALQTNHNRIATGQQGKEGETKQTQP